MSLQNGEFEFSLRKPIEVSGVDGEVNLLTFHEVGIGLDGYYMKLRKFMISAQINAPEIMKKLDSFRDKEADVGLKGGDEIRPLHETKEETHEEESEALAHILKLCLGATDELEAMVQIFNNMVRAASKSVNPICTAQGIALKEHAWDTVHIEDKIDAVARYVSFFGIGSVKPESKESDPVPAFHSEAKAL